MFRKALLAIALSALAVDAFLPISKRVVFPAPVKDYKTIVTPQNVTIRYKEPGKAGVCETTPGVNSYSGYIDLGPNMHAFFWFFESRRDPKNDPVSIWLNGGPGSDSQIGLFQELGPCSILKDLKSKVNPYSWSEISNFIFLSQPYGVGFSYAQEEEGSHPGIAGTFVGAGQHPPTGRYPVVDALLYDTTQLAAISAWHILQGFYDALPQLASNVKSKEFNLWTESYGGHYGPAFFNYFQQQNNLIGSGKEKGVHLTMNSLGIGNGIISELIQAPYYPEFANHNTYGIKAYNDTVYNYAKFAYYMGNGCHDQILYCKFSDQSTVAGKALCSEAQGMCRDNVESPYYVYSGRGVYDIRHPYADPTPPKYFIKYLNQGYVQQAIGVDLNYTDANNNIYFAFQSTGDFVYTSLLDDLEDVLNSGVRVALYYGDADYICNWFGGEAVSKQVKYAHTKEFNAAGYVPFMVDGKEYGEVRQYGNFSFLRIYEAGHEVPFYQPLAALAQFNRTINHFDIATGTKKVTGDLETHGKASATHTEPYVPLPSKTGSSDVQAKGPFVFFG